jgi:glucuronoarabinoxylan endo-1,4-beta-xylanase
MNAAFAPMLTTRLLPAALVCLTFGCAGGETPSTPTPTPTPTPAETLEVRVTTAQVFQRISGFGGSSAWHATPPSDREADLLFSTGSGAGLSLLRLRIAPDGTTWETPWARAAQARGASVWAAPWSPPGAWKSNGSDVNGGRLLPEFYDDWAARLADFAVSLEQDGVPLIYLSAQNEPGWVAAWETCVWTAAELLQFVRDHLGPALQARGATVPLLVPESNDWLRLREFADPLLADPLAASYVGVIAVHAYGGSPFAYTTPSDKGKEFWETEWSTPVLGAGMASGLDVARSIHNHLTTANMNAWHYWWVTDGNVNQAGALIQAGTATKRLWVMGNFSRFVRPGSRRVSAEIQNPPATPAVYVCAFRNDAAARLIVVAINATTVTRPIRCNLADAQADLVEPWVTSELLDLARQTALAGGASFSYDLPPQSVTTFVANVRY